MRSVLVGCVWLAFGCSSKATQAPPPEPPSSPTSNDAPPATAPAMLGELDGAHGFCNLGSQGMCMEFPPDGIADGEQLCTNFDGVWASEGCPAADAVGLCTNPVRGGGARLWLYGAVYGSADNARVQKCSDEDDVFSASP
jgi:hypothetical protein